MTQTFSLNEQQQAIVGSMIEEIALAENTVASKRHLLQTFIIGVLSAENIGYPVEVKTVSSKEVVVDIKYPKQEDTE